MIELVSKLIYHKKNNKVKNMFIERIKKKDMNALINWMEEKKDRYYKIGWCYLCNQYDIEDVFQTTIIKGYENIWQLKEERYFETWITSIFINECKKIIKNKKRSIPFENIHQANTSYEDHTNFEFIEQLNKLEDIHKEVILLKYISGYSQEEISRSLHIPVGTVKSRIYRALKALKNQINKEGV